MDYIKFSYIKLLGYGIFGIIILAFLPNIIEFLYIITVYAATLGDILSYSLIIITYFIIYIILRIFSNKFDIISNKIPKITIYMGFLHIYGCILVSSFFINYFLIIFNILIPIILWKKTDLIIFLTYIKYTNKLLNPFAKIFFDYNSECLIIPKMNKYIYIKIIEIEPFKDFLPFLISISRINTIDWFTIEVNKMKQDYSVYLILFFEAKNYNEGIFRLIDTFARVIRILERLGYFYIIINDEILSEKIFFSIMESDPFIFNENGLAKNFPKIKIKKEVLEIKKENSSSTIRLYKIPYNYIFKLNDILKSSPITFYWFCQFKPLNEKDYELRKKEINTSLKKVYSEMQDKLIDKEKTLQFMIMMGSLSSNTNSDAFSNFAFGEKLWNKKISYEKQLMKYQTGELIGMFDFSCYLVVDSKYSENIKDILGIELSSMPAINFFNVLFRKIKSDIDISSKESLYYLPFPFNEIDNSN
ncbi:MAG: hypothetical protein ACTSPY_02485 [Candidatus Helarchaeota archaeon]